MAYDKFNVSITEGTRAELKDRGFVQCGDRWKYGRSCDCTDAQSCKTVPVSKQAGMTVLDANLDEWRVYCRDGGYVGQGDGYDRIFLIDENWVERTGTSVITNRIISTVRK